MKLESTFLIVDNYIYGDCLVKRWILLVECLNLEVFNMFLDNSIEICLKKRKKAMTGHKSEFLKRISNKSLQSSCACR